MKLSAFLAHFDPVLDAGRGDFLVPCPAHGDGHPSLLVGQKADDGRLLIYCRAGCKTPDVLKAMGLETSDLFTSDKTPDLTRPATSAVADPDGPNVGDMAALAMYVRQCAEFLQDSEHGTEGQEYLARRFGVDLPLARRLGLGVDPGGVWYSGPLHFSATYTQVPRLTIPFRDFEGRTAGLQGRALVDHRVRWSGPSKPDPARTWSKVALFDLGTGLDTIIITEGPGDALSAVVGGFDALAIRGSGVANNAALQAEMARFLQGRRVVLAGDRDDAGEAFNTALGTVLQGAGVSVFVLDWAEAPANVKDLTAWREASPTVFLDALHRAAEGAYTFGTSPAANLPTRQNFTEVGLAATLRHRFRPSEGRDGVLYAEGLGFHLWNGAAWVADRKALRVRREAQEMALEMEREGREEFITAAGDANLENAAKAKIKAAIRAQGTTVLNGVLSELMPMVVVDGADLDAHPQLLAVRNGVIDLQTGALRPHDPALYLTRLVDVDFDIEAVAPRWEAFIQEVFPDFPGLPSYVQRLVGYGITGSTDEQAFAILWGRGANGKSVFTDTLTEVFRAISTTTPFSTFEQKPNGGIPNDLAALKGARLVFAAEGEQGRNMAESVIKRVTGSDLISARFMREEFFEFRPTFLIFLATNHKPRFKGQDEGLWRRVKMLPWSRYFAPHERDHHLTKDLRAEAAGILAWAVRGSIEWYATGLRDPAEVIDATQGYRETSDPLAGFVETYLVAEPGARVAAPIVFEAYKTYATEVEGVRESDVWQPRTFYEALEERGFSRKKARMGSKVGQVLLDCRLLTEGQVAHGLDDEHDMGHDSRPVGNPR